MAHFSEDLILLQWAYATFNQNEVSAQERFRTARVEGNLLTALNVSLQTGKFGDRDQLFGYLIHYGTEVMVYVPKRYESSPPHRLWLGTPEEYRQLWKVD